METFKIITLSLSSLLFLFVSISRLFRPIKTFSKSSGIQLANDVDLLNELRGQSGVMFLGVMAMIAGIFISELTFTSLVIACMLFFGFLIGRIMGMLSDGSPNKQIKQGMIFELILGLANLIALLF